MFCLVAFYLSFILYVWLPPYLFVSPLRLGYLLIFVFSLWKSHLCVPSSYWPFNFLWHQSQKYIFTQCTAIPQHSCLFHSSIERGHCHASQSTWGLLCNTDWYQTWDLLVQSPEHWGGRQAYGIAYKLDTPLGLGYFFYILRLSCIYCAHTSIAEPSS